MPCIVHPPQPDFIRDADTEELHREITGSDTGSESSFAGQKGNKGHLLMRVIKQASITSKAWLVIAVSQIKESHPRKRDQTLY